MASKRVVFVNNGPYENRGCEAIIRGTVTALSSVRETEFKNVAHFRSARDARAHNDRESDRRIYHIAAGKDEPRYVGWFRRKLGLPATLRLSPQVNNVLREGELALSLGGDNYSFDYGYPDRMVFLDEVVFKSAIPHVVWGASIGPFGDDSVYERKMAQHLARMELIFAREDETSNYLDHLGLGNKTVLMADPAFLLPAQEPNRQSFGISPGAIGLNLSPILGRYLGCRTASEWRDLARRLVQAFHSRFDRKLYLVWHVDKKGNSDWDFMRSVLADTGLPEDRVEIFPRDLNASELKFLIAKLDAFAGARTHATIAAMSSGVPTLSLAYSRKAFGINRMVFGSLDYCIGPNEFSIGECVDRMESLLSDKNPRGTSDKVTKGLEALIDAAARKVLSLGG